MDVWVEGGKNYGLRMCMTSVDSVWKNVCLLTGTLYSLKSQSALKGLKNAMWRKCLNLTRGSHQIKIVLSSKSNEQEGEENSSCSDFPELQEVCGILHYTEHALGTAMMMTLVQNTAQRFLEIYEKPSAVTLKCTRIKKGKLKYLTLRGFF